MNRIIKDRTVFSEDHLPDQIRERKNQLEAIKEEIKATIHRGEERYVLIHGPPGTGKTSSAKFLTKKGKTHLGKFFSAYVNCWTRYTRFKVLYSIVEQSKDYRVLHSHLTSSEELVEKLEEIKNRQPVVLVIDEVDQLRNSDVLYDLTGGEIALLLIAGEATSLYQMDPRTQSRLSGKVTIKFPRYSHRELCRILDDRKKAGLGRQVLSDENLERIADKASGDARCGIRIMRIAAEHAQGREAGQITGKDIEYGAEESVKVYRRKSLSDLNKHQQTLYKIVRGRGPISPGRLYKLYKGRIKNPVSKRTARRYRKRMERYNLLSSSGRGKGKTIEIVK